MTRVSKPAFFINPLSHTVAKHGSVLAKSENDQADIFRLDDFTALNGYVTKAAQNGCDLIFVEGGDGTIQGVLSEVLRQKDRFKTMPRFVLLSGGMTNLVASNIGIKKPSPRDIHTIIGAPAAAQKSEMPLLKVQTSDQKELFGFLFSTGAFPAATQYCYDTVHKEGIGGSKAIRVTMSRVLFGNGDVRREILAPTKMDLRVDSGEARGEHLMGIATTLPKLLVGMNPFWGDGDGALRFTRLDAGARRKALNVAKMLKSKHSPAAKAALARDGFRSWRTQTAVLNYDGRMVLDGEFIDNPSGPITLSTTSPLTFLGRAK